ncbi:MAG: VgrG-related protein, partial [Anaerolineae bacterium]|nr:VgrG-related protein [Anaerolineae bacterium]
MPQQPGLEWVEQIRIKVNGQDLQTEQMDKVLEVTVDSSLYLPDMAIIHIVDTDEFKILESGPFDLGKTLEIEMPLDEQVATTIAVFKGEVVAIEPAFNDDLGATTTIRAYDKSHRLNRGTKSRAFLNVTDGDIVQKIASENGLSAQVSNPGEVYDHVYQHNLTDMQFLTQRAQRLGYEVLVDDRTLYFRKPTGSRGNIELEWGTKLRSFKPRMTLWRQVDTVTVKGWNPQEKKEIVGKATSSQSSPKIGFGKNGGQAAQAAIGAAEEVVVRRPVATQREADLLAQALLDEINAGFIEADGVAIGNPNIKSGMKVKIAKVGSKFSGEYMVTAARHIYTPEGYETEFSVQGARPQLMTDLIESQSVFNDHEPYWGGVVPAIVDNINDPDKKGRIKLRYPWLDNTLQSGWARVAALGAGKNRGFIWMPEVDDEVLVAFEHGDFNRPYIVGSLWNGKDSPPEAWDDAVKGGKSEIRTMKSREGHIIRMVDGPSEMFIEIVDAKQGTTIKLDAKTKKLSIDSKDEISIKSST